MRFIFLFLTLLITSSSVLANDSTWISGHDITYAGTEIVFNRYSDQISGAEEVIVTAKVDPEGNFNAAFSLDEITQVFAYLGVYKIHIFAVPGKTYNIILPPRQDKQPEDFLNPYFSPEIVHLGTEQFDPNEINSLIRMFNDAYLPYYNKHILKLNSNNDFAELDDDIARMEKPFSMSTDSFFNNYRRYRYGMLRHLAFQHKTKSISADYFRDQPVLLNNIAYMELFNKVYDKYFYHFAVTPEGKLLGESINNRDLRALRSTLINEKVLGSGDLLDLVIIKSLYDEFYDDNYSRSALLDMLDTIIKTVKSPRLIHVAKSVRFKVTRLLVGFEPPPFRLFDRDSNLVGLGNFKGKYVYLNFCSCFSYTCLNEFIMLNTLYEKHKDILEIVTVLIDNDKDVINSFLNRSKYPWVFLHYGNQSSIIREYDIRAFPTYYLIDRNGKLAISPAPSPAEEFEARFFKLLREKGDL